jgi:hypothetical protein
MKNEKLILRALAVLAVAAISFAVYKEVKKRKALNEPL